MTDSRSPEETAEWALNDAVNALNCMATNVSFHDAAISEAWMKSKRTVTTMRDRLADPALGEAIKQMQDNVIPHMTRMLEQSTHMDSYGWASDMVALGRIISTITALRSPAHE